MVSYRKSIWERVLVVGINFRGTNEKLLANRKRKADKGLIVSVKCLCACSHYSNPFKPGKLKPLYNIQNYIHAYFPHFFLPIKSLITKRWKILIFRFGDHILKCIKYSTQC